MLNKVYHVGRHAAQQLVRTPQLPQVLAASHHTASWTQRVQGDLRDYQAATHSLVHVPTAAVRTIDYNKKDKTTPLIGIKEVFYNCVGVYIKSEDPANGDVKASLVHFHRPEDSVELLRDALKVFDKVPREQMAVTIIRNMECFHDQNASTAQKLHMDAHHAVKDILKEHQLVGTDKLIENNRFALKPDGNVFYFSPVKQWLSELLQPTPAAASSQPTKGRG